MGSFIYYVNRFTINNGKEYAIVIQLTEKYYLCDSNNNKEILINNKHN